jgi:hypothetical protein
MSQVESITKFYEQIKKTHGCLTDAQKAQYIKDVQFARGVDTYGQEEYLNILAKINMKARLARQKEIQSQSGSNPNRLPSNWSDHDSNISDHRTSQSP